MILEEIRKQLKTSDKSLNQIGRETGIDKAALSRIMNGGSCKAETLEILLNHFGYEIRKKKTVKRSKHKKAKS
jgi:transcriptional regulator with XRE-family HTH domain